MPFYVPVGPRGAIFRCGNAMTNVFGGWTYWRALTRRRRATIAALRVEN
jgi:hypothetical protein